MIKNPKGNEETYYNTTGAWVAAPTVSNIIKRMVNILGIPPLENEQIYKAEMEKLSVRKNNSAVF